MCVPFSHVDSLLNFKAQAGVAAFPSVANLFFPATCFHKACRILNLLRPLANSAGYLG